MSISSQFERVESKIAESYTAVEEKGGTLPSSLIVENLPDAILSIPQRLLVSYSTEHGTAPQQILKLYGSTLTADDLAELSFEGYDFKGWWNADYTRQYQVGDEVLEDIQLVAKWEHSQAQVSISYSTEHGTTPQSKSVDYGYHLTAEDLPTLSEDGWIFKGWDKSVGYEVIEDTIITASWEQADDRLCFTAEQENSTITLNKNGSPADISLVVSTDGANWDDYTIGETITLANIGDKVYMRAKTENETISSSSSKYYQFTMTGKIKADGNIQYLLDSTGQRLDIPTYCYQYMFQGCTGLIETPELPATTLANSCYAYMFSGCTSLTKAPELPATTLADRCYQYMFQDCTGLTQPPELPATTLDSNCYQYMFQDCTSLTKAPELPATTVTTYCYRSMFQGCTGLIEAPELPATTVTTYCYAYMFSGCTSLTKTPELPATTLANSCYTYMFSGCTGLIETPELPATTLANYCYRSMFQGCTGLIEAPELPATTVTTYCYAYMFSGCTGIKLSKTQTGEYQTPYRIPKEGTGTIAGSSLSSMFGGTGGTFTGTPEINTTYYGAW